MGIGIEGLIETGYTGDKMRRTSELSDNTGLKYGIDTG